MNEKQYHLLCEACDRVLQSTELTIERVAIAWLHVLNEHPTNLAKYLDLFAGKHLSPFIGVKSMLLQAIQCFKLRQRSYSIDCLTNNVDVIFVSHLLNSAQLGAEEDFYFGSLPEILNENGISNIVILRDHRSIDQKNISIKRKQGMSPRFLLPNVLPLTMEAFLWKCLHSEAIHLRAQAKKSKKNLHQRILFHSSKHAISSLSIATLRLYHQILSIVERIRPKAIVVTYEGHAWERLAFAAARKIVPEVLCIGYHHTILRPLSHSIERSLGSLYDPDYILTAGNITREMIKNKLTMPHTKVNVLGTHRKTQEIPLLSIKKSSCCLIIPEGIIDESTLLLDFALKCSYLAPNVHFILRLHPIISFKELEIRDSRLKKFPSNFELSKKSITDDFLRSRWALYRSSSAAVFSILAGVRPIYLSQENEIKIDPLHELTSWRCIVNQPADFLSIVIADSKMTISEQIKEFTPAHFYCKQYFMPMNFAGFKKIITG
ncbi:MAG: hypothetical protein HQK79_10125 [Desulfobacterales bacterium]|nr:hypothetical protein [Desulfobacterales bacterium]